MTSSQKDLKSVGRVPKTIICWLCFSHQFAGQLLVNYRCRTFCMCTWTPLNLFLYTGFRMSSVLLATHMSEWLLVHRIHRAITWRLATWMMENRILSVSETRRRRIGAIGTLNCITTLTGMSIAHINQNLSVEGISRHLGPMHDYGAGTMVHHATDV